MPRTKHAQKVALFIEHYLSNGANGAKAYVDAGWKASTPQVAAAEAHKLLRKPEIAEAVAKRHAEVIARAQVTTDELLASAAREVRFDPRKLVDDKGKRKDLQKLDDDTALALKVVEIDGLKVRVDRGAAREQLMRYHGMFKDEPPLLPGVLEMRVGKLTARLSFETVMTKAKAAAKRA